MGVPKFLSEVLGPAGRKVDLSTYAGEGIVPWTSHQSTSGQRRPLRIGVDVSTWIHRSCQGYGDMLGDERHLSNYGRATLHFQVQGTATPVNPNAEQEKVRAYVTACTIQVVQRLSNLKKASGADILIVLDGATPPIKGTEVRGRSDKRKEAAEQRDKPVDPTGDEDAQEDRVKGNRRAGAGKYFGDVVNNVIEALRLNQIPFLVSPYESDGQLTYFANQGYIDLIITEDSDLVAYGASPIVFKVPESIGDGLALGIMLRREDLGSTQGSLNLADFSPVMMAVMFSAAGSDYCQKLRGIGIITACNIVRTAFLGGLSDDLHPIQIVFDMLYEKSGGVTTEEFKAEFEHEFISALFMYRHPMVYDPVQSCCIFVGDPDESLDPELESYKPYADLCSDDERRAEVAGTVFDPPMATCIAEGWISPRTMEPRENVELPPHVQAIIDQALRDAETEVDSQQLESQDIATHDTQSQLESQDIATQDSASGERVDASQQAHAEELGSQDIATQDSATGLGNGNGGPNGGSPSKVVEVKSEADQPMLDVGNKRKTLSEQPESERSPKKVVNFHPEVIELTGISSDEEEDNLETQAP